ncbi:hypothetical protein HOY80DRAFT_880350 [Tuber brumale]|nr:hypothetical protein HOY80DRAFT_880350 [Tuber brumale]
MKFHTLTIPLTLSLLPLTRAQGLGGGVREIQTTTTGTNAPAEPTKVLVPSTLANGLVTKVASIYTQQFTGSGSGLRTPSAGTIGLGTLTGSVGVVRTAEANAAVGRGRARGGAEGGGVGVRDGRSCMGWMGVHGGDWLSRLLVAYFGSLEFFFLSPFPVSPVNYRYRSCFFFFSIRRKERERYVK